MINWPVTRDDIKVWREEDGTLFIRIGDDQNNFMCSAKGEGATRTAIKTLSEKVQKVVLGITEHDLIMKTDEFFMSEKGVRE